MADLKKNVTTSSEDKYSDNDLPLPLHKMPQCWNDEERINALFSPFRSKSANSQDYISKYTFWKNLIYESLKHSMRCSVTVADLNKAFKRKGCSPLCLATVVEELVRNNEIIPETEYLKEPCTSWTTWSIDVFLKRPLTWSLSKVKNYIISNEINIETRYIHLQIVKELGEIIISILEDKKENVLVPFSEIVQYCKCSTSQNISDDTVMFGLIWLRRLKRVAIKDTSENVLLIRKATHAGDCITEVEEQLYKLIRQEDQLIREIELMEEEKINIINEVKLQLSKGMRQMAKRYLRKKLELEKAIERRAQVHDNLQSLISSIQDVHTNSSVLSAYKTGSDALRKLNESGLSESNVKDVMDDLLEVLEEHKEVQSLLSETLNNESDADLERELTELMNADDNVFPTIPDTQLDSEVDELQQNLENLHFKDSKKLDVVSLKSPAKLESKKKVLLHS